MNSENDRDLRCARWMFEMILTIRDRFKRPNFQVWARDIRLMRERDGRTYDEIYQVFRWANENEFWRVNILSPAKLRKQFDRLALQMELETKKKPQRPTRKPVEHSPSPMRANTARTGGTASLKQVMEKSRPDQSYYQLLEKIGIKPQAPEEDEEPAQQRKKQAPRHRIIHKKGRCSNCGKSVAMIVIFREMTGVYCLDCAQSRYEN